MELFGIGLPEVILILLLALVIMGPRDMTNSARKLARWIYRLFRSPQWREFIGAAKEAREMPRQLIREAGLEEEINMLKQAGQEMRGIARETTQEVNGLAREANADLRQAAQEAAPPTEEKNS